MANEVELEKVSKSVFGITSRRYRQMAGEEIVPPVVKGKIDFVAASKALIAYYRKLAEGQGSLSLTDERTKKTVVERQIKELLYDKLQESLVPREQAKQWLSTIIAEARLAIMGLPRRMAGILVLETDERNIETLLRTEVNKILWQLTKPLGRKGGDHAKRRRTKIKIKNGRSKRGLRAGGSTHEKTTELNPAL